MGTQIIKVPLSEREMGDFIKGKDFLIQGKEFAPGVPIEEIDSLVVANAKNPREAMTLFRGENMSFSSLSIKTGRIIFWECRALVNDVHGKIEEKATLAI